MTTTQIASEFKQLFKIAHLSSQGQASSTLKYFFKIISRKIELLLILPLKLYEPTCSLPDSVA